MKKILAVVLLFGSISVSAYAGGYHCDYTIGAYTKSGTIDLDQKGSLVLTGSTAKAAFTGLISKKNYELRIFIDDKETNVYLFQFQEKDLRDAKVVAMSEVAPNQHMTSFMDAVSNSKGMIFFDCNEI